MKCLSVAASSSACRRSPRSRAQRKASTIIAWIALQPAGWLSRYWPSAAAAMSGMCSCSASASTSSLVSPHRAMQSSSEIMVVLRGTSTGPPSLVAKHGSLLCLDCLVLSFAVAQAGHWLSPRRHRLWVQRGRRRQLRWHGRWAADAGAALERSKSLAFRQLAGLKTGDLMPRHLDVSSICLSLTAACITFLLALPAVAQERVALVVGNSAYAHAG